ncbi:MAG: CPXCG motif-containing cysteine-rich protein [Ghiorsea sp.]
MTYSDTTAIECPYCWEFIEVVIDHSQNHQEYIEDCSVCCRPINIHVDCENGNLTSISALSEND